jgi:hypothetical protein
MTKPTVPSVTWASAAGAVIGTPPTGLQGLGWAAGEQPTAAHLNWSLNWMSASLLYFDPFFGSTAGDLKATHLYPYVGTSTCGLTLNAGTSAGTNGVLISGITNAVKIEVSSAGPTLEHAWQWKPDGSLVVSLTDSIDWGTSAIQTNVVAEASATTALRYGYPLADRPSITYDVSPAFWPYQIEQPFQATSGPDFLAGRWKLHNYAGGTRTTQASGPLPRHGLISDTSSSVMLLTGLSAVLTKDGTVTEVYFRVRRRSIASWGTTANVATVSSSSPTWSGSVALDFSTYAYWLEFEIDSASSGSGNGVTAERCTVTLTPYGADV